MPSSLGNFWRLRQQYLHASTQAGMEFFHCCNPANLMLVFNVHFRNLCAFFFAQVAIIECRDYLSPPCGTWKWMATPCEGIYNSSDFVGEFHFHKVCLYSFFGFIISEDLELHTVTRVSQLWSSSFVWASKVFFGIDKFAAKLQYSAANSGKRHKDSSPVFARQDSCIGQVMGLKQKVPHSLCFMFWWVFGWSRFLSGLDLNR